LRDGDFKSRAFTEQYILAALIEQMTRENPVGFQKGDIGG